MRSADRARAVSYTHLDVYKRQKITVIFEKEQGPVNTGDKTWEKACMLMIIGAAGAAGMLVLPTGRKKPLN